MFKKQNLHGWILIGLALVVKIFSLQPEHVERYYSQSFYPFIASIYRMAFGWIPFSVGDILYAIAGYYLLKGVLRFIRKLFKKEHSRESLLLTLRKGVLISLIVYVAFNIGWGLNYNRVPLVQQLKLEVEPYSVDQLSRVVSLLIDSLNAIDSSGISDIGVLKTKKTIFTEAIHSYQVLEMNGKSFQYYIPSLKPSMYSYPGNFMGFSGYYNPFTGEAQVNTTIPDFTQPFVACHEIGHQLGYGKEDEANFVGFLAASTATSKTFRYSAYFDMYSYARRELYRRDSSQMKLLHAKLNPKVKNDLIIVREFSKRYENPIESLITLFYAEYLKANEQPQGIKSYNAVVSMLVAFYKKQGVI